MKKILIAAALALAAPSAFANDQQAIDECISAWGSKSPFKKGTKAHHTIATGVKVFGLGKGQADNDPATDKPVLVLVRPAVNVMGKSTIRLANPKGWYCLRNQTTVAGKIAVEAHCNAQIASSKDDGTAVFAADDSNKGVAVMGALRLTRFGCAGK